MAHHRLGEPGHRPPAAKGALGRLGLFLLSVPILLWSLPPAFTELSASVAASSFGPTFLQRLPRGLALGKRGSRVTARARVDRGRRSLVISAVAVVAPHCSDRVAAISSGDADAPKYPGAGKVTVDYPLKLQDFLSKGGVLPADDARQLLSDAEALLSKRSTLVRVPLEEEKAPINVIGDVHGQFFDLLKIFEVAGEPSPNNRYLFNGDFVDRGSYSVEVALTLFAWQLALPDHFYLSRGNHEYDEMNQRYGFLPEVRAKYANDFVPVYKQFLSTFTQLPLAHVIGEQVFVVHGGLPTDLRVSVADIERAGRSNEFDEISVPLMWSDPREENGLGYNMRGIGTRFGPDHTEAFLNANNLNLVIRSHEVRDEGYEIEQGGRLITVFSAPRYCDSLDNDGAIVRLRKEAGVVKYKVARFTAAARPRGYVPAMFYA